MCLQYADMGCVNIVTGTHTVSGEINLHDLRLAPEDEGDVPPICSSRYLPSPQRLWKSSPHLLQWKYIRRGPHGFAGWPHAHLPHFGHRLGPNRNQR